MKNIFQDLFSLIRDTPVVYMHSGTIFFKINHFTIFIVLDINEEFDRNLALIENFSSFNSFSNDLKIIDFKIIIDEDIRKRNALCSYKINKENLIPFSLTNTIFSLIMEISKIDSKLVIYYNFNLGDLGNECAASENYYIGEIKLDSNYLINNNLKQLIDVINSINLVPLEELYFPIYANTISIDSLDAFHNNYSEQFVNTNTKVRRLGYLKLFFSFIKEREKIPENFVNKKFEDYALEHSSKLNANIYSKGIIQKANGKSAEPYISLLKELDLITNINRLILPTKWLKTYQVLRVDYMDNGGVFKLDELDKLFFLEVLLRKDFLYLSIILEILIVNQSIETNVIIQKFQGIYLMKLDRFINQEKQKTNQHSIAKVRAVIKRVSEWKKPKIYLEHIVMPRINWLADLELIKFDKNIVSLNPNSERLVGLINSWNDLVCENILDSSEFLKNYYPHIFSKSYHENLGHTLFEEEFLIELIDVYTEKSFEKFKTLAPNRVTSSQSFTYVKYSIYLESNITVSEKKIEHIILHRLNKKYIYKYQTRYGDGYLQKII